MSFVVLFVGCFMLNFNVATYVETLDSLVVGTRVEFSKVAIQLECGFFNTSCLLS